MDSIQFTLDVHLKRIIQDPKSFILKQHELSEATYPLLVSYLAWLRKINGYYNRADVMHQNEQKLREFKFLCKHNLLFFLTVTGQFNAIEKIFKTPSFAIKLRHLIALIKKERYKARQEKMRQLEIKLTKNTEIHHHEHLSKYVHGISNMVMYHYYIKETQRLNAEYHTKKEKIIFDAYMSKIEHLVHVIKAIKTVKNMEPFAKESLLHHVATVYQHALENKEIFKATTNHYIDKEDIQVLRFVELQLQAWKQLHDDTSEINTIFYKCKHITPELAEIYMEDICSSKKIDESLEKLMREYHQQHDEFGSHAEKTRDATTEDIDNSLIFLMQFAKNSLVNKLDTKQEIILNKSLAQLKLYKKELKKTEHFDSLYKLLHQCGEELQTIEAIIKAVLPIESVNFFVKNMEYFNEMMLSNTEHQMKNSKTKENDHIVVQQLTLFSTSHQRNNETIMKLKPVFNFFERKSTINT